MTKEVENEELLLLGIEVTGYQGLNAREKQTEANVKRNSQTLGARSHLPQFVWTAGTTGILHLF